MTPNALDRIERELSLVLPVPVREVLQDRAVFNAVRGRCADAMPIGPGLITYEAAVAETETSIISGTRRARSEVQWCGWNDIPKGGPDAWRQAMQPWRDNWLCLGSDFSGDTWFLDLDRAPASLDIWEHDGSFCRVIEKDFVEWARRAAGGPGT